MPKRPRTKRRVSRQSSVSSGDMADLMRDIAEVGFGVLRERLPPTLSPYLDLLEQAAERVVSGDNAATTSQPDPYVVLGVDRSQPMKEITARWRHLIQLLHPDKMGDRRMFDLVMAAYRHIQAERK